MDLKKIKSFISTGSRTFGLLLLAGVLLAACGDDDDNGDGDDVDTTPTISLTAPSGSDSTASVSDAPTATSADAESTGAEDPTDSTSESTETEEEGDTTSTEEESSASTEEDDDATATEDEDDGTGTATESDSTPTESDADATGTDDDSTGTAAESDEDTAEIGEAIEVGQLMITVDGLADFPGLPGILEPDSGNQYVAVSITIENSGTDPQSLLEAFGGIYLETSDGERYDVDLPATAIMLLDGDSIEDMQIEAGDEVSGDIGFQIPEDVDELVLVVKNDATGDEIKVDLTDEL